MKEKNQRSMMEKEIQFRLDNDFWDKKIARNVLQRRNKKTRLFAGSAISALAAAAVIVVVFFMGIKSEINNNPYDSFITSQVQGTYQKVYTGTADRSNNYTVSEEYYSSDDIDTLIDDTLAVR